VLSNSISGDSTTNINYSIAQYRKTILI